MEKDFPARRVRAFTLLELLVVLAVAAIVVGIAVPAWGNFLAGVRVQTATAELVSSLHTARSEAIKRQLRVTLCKSVDGKTCEVNGGWQQGWIMFAETTNYGVIDHGEPVLRVSTGEHDRLQIHGNSEFARLISYTPLGVTRLVSGAWGMGSLKICGGTGKGVDRKIYISQVGRPRVEPITCE